MPSGLDLARAARDWLGAPWVHQGRVHAGCDCGGLVLGVARSLGLTDAIVTGYGRIPFNGELESVVAQHMTPVADPAPGDVALIRFLRAPTHLAILTERDTIIHSYEPYGVIEHRLDHKWRGRVVSWWRWPGVMNG